MSIVETERLILRPWREDDAENLYKYARDPRVGPAAGWAVHKDAAESLNILRTVLMAENTWAVTIRGSDEPVGSIGCFPCCEERAHGAPEIGYWIGVPFWGKGYIPEAVRALIARCFGEGAPSVWCAHFEGNDKSRRVIEKCGFRYQFNAPFTGTDGIEHQSLYYRILPEEFDA